LSSRRHKAGTTGAVLALLLPVESREIAVVFVGVHSDGNLFHGADEDLAAKTEHSQLLKFFHLLQVRWRQRRKLKQERTPVGVQPEVLQEVSRASVEFGPAIALARDGTAAEVEGSAVGGTDDFYAVGIAPLLFATNGHGQGSYVGGGMLVHH